jgi:hypothetical protein
MKNYVARPYKVFNDFIVADVSVPKLEATQACEVSFSTPAQII